MERLLTSRCFSLILYAFLFASLLLLTSCGGASNSSGLPPGQSASMSGLWEIRFGAAVAVSSITQTDQSISGFTHIFPFGYDFGPECYDSASRLPVTGTVEPNDNFTIDIRTPARHIQFTGTLSPDHRTFRTASFHIIYGCDAGNGGLVEGATSTPLTGTFDVRMVSDSDPTEAGVRTMTLSLTQSDSIGLGGERIVTGTATVAWPCYSGQATGQLAMLGGNVTGEFLSPGNVNISVFFPRYELESTVMTGTYNMMPLPTCPSPDYGKMTITRRTTQ